MSILIFGQVILKILIWNSACVLLKNMTSFGLWLLPQSCYVHMFCILLSCSTENAPFLLYVCVVAPPVPAFLGKRRFFFCFAAYDVGRLGNFQYYIC